MCAFGIMLVLAIMQAAFLGDLQRSMSLPIWLATTAAGMFVLVATLPYSAAAGVLLLGVNAAIALPQLVGTGDAAPAEVASG